MTPPAAPQGKRGNDMEYLSAAVFQSQGYLVRRGIPLQVGPGSSDVTDIDVFGVRFSQPFQIHRVVCDCKDRQRSRPYERIFWAKGLGAFVGASETYVALPRPGVDVIHFAKRGQVRVLPEDVLREAARAYTPFSFANKGFADRLEKSVHAGMKRAKQSTTVLAQTRRLYLADDPYVAMNIAMINLKLAADTLRGAGGLPKEVGDLWQVIAGELLVVCPILLLMMASDTLGLSKEQRAKHITEHLTYGDLPPQKAEEFFDLARQVALEAGRAANPKLPASAPLPFDLGEIEAPSYSADVVGLVERAINQPALYIHLPSVMDYLVFEQSVQHSTFSDQEFRVAFPGATQEEKLKIARNIFVFARDAAKLNLGVFWPRQEGNLPRAPNAGPIAAPPDPVPPQSPTGAHE